jgi:Ca2+-binding EF-hand superfamily protein
MLKQGKADLGPPVGRYRLKVIVSFPRDASGAGLVFHAPSYSAFAQKVPPEKEGIAVWIDNEGQTEAEQGSQDQLYYRVSGQDLISEPRSKAVGKLRSVAAPDDSGRPWFFDRWDILVDGQRGLISLGEGKVRFRFTARVTGGFIAFFAGAKARAHFKVEVVEVGTATCPRPTAAGKLFPDPEKKVEKLPGLRALSNEGSLTALLHQQNFSLMPAPQTEVPMIDGAHFMRGRKWGFSGDRGRVGTAGSSTSVMSRSLHSSHSAPGGLRQANLSQTGLFESNDLAMSATFAEYKRKCPTHVFEPAYSTLKRRKRHILLPPKTHPWLISACYNSPTLEAYQSLRLQREKKVLAKQQTLSKMKRRKKTIKNENSVDDAVDDDDVEDGSAAALLGHANVETLRGIFDKFDRQSNGWVENADVARMLMMYCGHQKPQTALAKAAVAKITSYTAVDFNNLLDVVIIFNELEAEELGTIFDAAALETAGIDDVRSLLLEIGDEFFTWAIHEHIASMAAAGRGVIRFGDEDRLNKEGFVTITRELRKTGGFTEEEHAEFRAVFSKFDSDGSGEIGTVELKRMLMFLGFPISDLELKALIDTVDTDKSGEIDESEFLVCMRIYTQKMARRFYDVFKEFDEDDSDEMSTEEVYGCVKKLGWFPTEELITECVGQVDEDGSGSITFDEFYQMMNYLRKTEGFTVNEMNKFRNLFNKFDVDGSGEISTLELAGVLRNLGYPSALDVLQAIISEVDIDGSGAVDFGELLKLLRKYRNRELEEASGLYKFFTTSYDGIVPRHAFGKILASFGWDPTPTMVEKAQNMVEGDITSWNQFLNLVEMYRELELEEFRNRAGFSEVEVGEFREIFEKYDKDGGGALTFKELMPALKDLGKAPQTPSQQKMLIDLVNEIDEDGSGEIAFSEFLQLMRKFSEESEAEKLRREKEAIQRTGFTPEEVAQWRDIFMKFDDDNSGSFDLSEGKALLQAVGINLNHRQMYEDYQRVFRKVDDDNSGTIDYPKFLLMMRELLDTNFGDIRTRFGM